jgi:hypothetical protein
MVMSEGINYQANAQDEDPAFGVHSPAACL